MSNQDNQTITEVDSENTESILQENKYLTFTLGGEEYGLEILTVREIIGIMNITAVPRTPEYVQGVINLRGKVIPVINLRRKFSLDDADFTEQTCIIVVNIDQNGHSLIIGVIVDSVSEVLDIKDTEIEPPPAFGEKVDIRFIWGLAKINDSIKILLDIEKILLSEELEDIAKSVDKSTIS